MGATKFSLEARSDLSNSGCQGGLMNDAFQYMIDHQGGSIETEAAYPYTSGSGLTGKCKKACTPAVTVSKFKDVPKGDEIALKIQMAMEEAQAQADLMVIEGSKVEFGSQVLDIAETPGHTEGCITYIDRSEQSLN